MTEDATPSTFWRDRPTFVTGATGLLGGWMVRRLLALGADVVCLVRDRVPRSVLLSTEMRDRVVLTYGDINDQALLERVLGEYEIDTVFHLAAQTIVGVANRNPASTFDANIRGTWALLEAARRSPLARSVVLASSDKSYGEHETQPYDETMALQGRHPYDVSKSCADLIGQAYAHTYELPVAITRCGNLYGGGDLNWNRIVPGTIRSVLRGQRPVIRSDGTYVRDYFYVEDAAIAYIELAQALREDGPALRGEAFNFSNESAQSVIDVVTCILRLMESELEPEIRDEATSEIHYQHLSAEKAMQTLTWSPRFDLESGLRRAISWYEGFLKDAP